MTPYYQDEWVTIYHGDCREVLPHVGHFDVLITDPPYGLDFSGKVTKDYDKRNTSTYASYQDSPESFRSTVLPAVVDYLSACKRAAIFPGTKMLHEYPQSSDIGGVFSPAGGGMSAWGFRCFHPVLFYGTSPYLTTGQGARPNAKTIIDPGGHVTGDHKLSHPCVKPLHYMTWLVETASLPAELIVDPFMGSGTTLVAAKQLNRRAIGIEIEERYCEIAAKRLSQGVLELI